MEPSPPSDPRIEVIIRCIHPNLNWKPQEGPDYSTRQTAMTTLVEDYRLRIRSSLLCKANFFKTIVEKDKLVVAKGKAIDIKLTARKNQVSIETLMMCFDYLDHESFFEIDINRKNMLSLLVTANFLNVPALENYCVDFVSNNFSVNNIVDIANMANQIKNLKLMDKAYM
jgi:hypothetical protein